MREKHFLKCDVCKKNRLKEEILPIVYVDFDGNHRARLVCPRCDKARRESQ